MWIDEFVSHLKKSTVDEPRLPQAFTLKDANLPKRLYRYRPISGEPGRWSLENLRDDTVWICSPEAYNDPYDCLFRVTESDVVTAAKRGLVKDFVRIFKLRELISLDAIKAARESDEPLNRIVEAIPVGRVFTPGSNPVHMAEFTSIQLPKYVRDSIRFVQQVRDATKVCSFTERNDSIVMWSHYADYHKGFCIEYDISTLHPDHSLRHSVFPVIYSSRLFDLTRWLEQLMVLGRKRFKPAVVLLAMMHKYKDWKYEKEWRYILTEPRLSPDRALQVPTPSRVFLGSRMSEAKRAELISICTGKGIEVWQMERAPDAFTLHTSRIA